jgi:hypothetical protein
MNGIYADRLKILLAICLSLAGTYLDRMALRKFSSINATVKSAAFRMVGIGLPAGDAERADCFQLLLPFQAYLISSNLLYVLAAQPRPSVNPVPAATLPPPSFGAGDGVALASVLFRGDFVAERFQFIPPAGFCSS